MRTAQAMLISWFLVGCQASASAQSSVNTGNPGEATGEATVAGSAEASGQATTAASTPAPAPGRSSEGAISSMQKDLASNPSGQQGNAALLGARHGLGIVGTSSPSCTCLVVAVGNPDDPRFSWDGPPPQIDPSSQIVVALTSEGISCPGAAPGSLGASYWGYEVKGQNVVIVVESAKLGRPLTSGAIVPKPGPNGKILIRPKDGTVPYGLSNDGVSNLCQVWPPA